MKFEEILKIPPYSLCKEDKEELLTHRLLDLTELHKEKCPEYAKILLSLNFDGDSIESYKKIPFLPVRLFKELPLKSVDESEIIKTMTSSGTSGQAVSRIFLNRDTSSNQQKTMVKIVSSFTGAARMPMIILDCPSIVKNRAVFSARGAGILGFSIFGSRKVYAFDDQMQLNVEAITEFLDKFKNERIFLFGFTFMVWQHFYKELVKLKENGIYFDLSKGILIHGGGWKKLINESVSREVFHDRLKDVCGLNEIHDYYGMVEQTGCIYMECEYGHIHASVFSDVIIRDPLNFKECEIGKTGVIQVVSTIPESYPGHSLLTEDQGMILGIDDCPCGRKGKYFKVLGRLKNAEIRGCSDTYAAKFK
ncbi:LuxE/PaaK family acyltransferase [Holdemania massiliensis]|uniref:Acyl-protein synthetase n=1 Tax=Holdemania massiliensis TaxID=1468449 RepID=A0A6N7S3J6_9FIRM|nr:acyl-protein synthetase [Holdemania massiliensis]MSA70574.1 acyl-protein synthetase [Holdemania massiliensis]MSA88447.1 acyl-protein synthetase [Holdemania massiliensis]MSB77653.1 acyl-protein synthetase [Holdemania massiliensis]MSC32579.1 acyl-protein synthetase [Holdemania massiliensis]MSC38899.1 acyl-protein synthetase [Holdemania massiliensis]